MRTSRLKPRPATSCCSAIPHGAFIGWKAKSGRMLVEDAHGSPPIPFWRGEAHALGTFIPCGGTAKGNQRPPAQHVSGRRLAGPSRSRGNCAWLKDECGLDVSGAEQVIEYTLEGRAVLGDVPTQATIITERFFDEGGGMQLVIHAPFGGRINKAWGLALRKRFCRSFNFELQAAATDNGLNIALAEQHSFPLADVFHFLNAETVQPILEQAALASPLFRTRWRWDATRALALLRFQGGKKVPPQIQRIRSDDLLASVFPMWPYASRTSKATSRFRPSAGARGNEGRAHRGARYRGPRRGAARDRAGTHSLPGGRHAGAVAVLARNSQCESVRLPRRCAARGATGAGCGDAARVAGVRARRSRRARSAAIAQVQQEAWPDVRDVDELHDVLHTLVMAAPAVSTQHSAFESA